MKALGILTALANGTHPATGEIFPVDSPYQTPEVVRALFCAVRLLESMRSDSIPLTVARAHSSQSEADAKRDKIAAGSGNAGKPWTADEDQQLLTAFDAGQSISALAAAHARTRNGIRARLEKHGRLEPSSATRWPVKAQPARTEVS